MKKEIIIDGMSCGHCVKRVENALKGLGNVIQVDVKLEERKALLELSADITDDVLIETIDDAGYDVVSIANL